MLEEQPVKIIGTLEKIVFKNPDSDYFIGKLRSEENHELMTIVGHMIEVQPGERISITGKWVENKKYGLQLEIASFEVIIPTTCLLYTSPSPRDGLLSRMPSSA